MKVKLKGSVSLMPFTFCNNNNFITCTIKRIDLILSYSYIEFKSYLYVWYGANGITGWWPRFILHRKSYTFKVAHMGKCWKQGNCCLCSRLAKMIVDVPWLLSLPLSIQITQLCHFGYGLCVFGYESAVKTNSSYAICLYYKWLQLSASCAHFLFLFCHVDVPLSLTINSFETQKLTFGCVSRMIM